MAVIAVGYRAPEEGSTATTVANASSTVTTPASNQPSVNDVIATSIAASAAKAADLAVAPNIAERAVSVRVQNQYSSMDTDSSVTKPTIVQPSSASRNITPYSVQPGDTVQSVASKFGVTVDTIKWANNLTTDTLAAGSSIDVLPRNGIAYTVKDGDSVEKLAEKYKADASLITTVNDIEISGLTTGLKIIIPDGVLPNTERPGYVAPISSYATTYARGSFVSGYGAWSGEVLGMRYMSTPSSIIGGYAPGNCTAYAFMRRAQLGMPIPSNLGNAYTWATQARAFGYLVDKNPSFGAVIQSGNHVGVIEEILPNGDLRITDMNYGYRLNNLAERIIPASTVHNYMFIH